VSAFTYTQLPRLLFAIASLAACRNNSAEIPRGRSIELSLDGAARTVAIDRPIALASLVDAAAASWIEVRADSRDDRWLELEAPSTTYPDAEIRLYVERDRAAIGVFPPVTADMRPEVAALAKQPLAVLDNVVRVEVLTRRDFKLSPLTVEIAGREVILTGEQVRALRALSGGKSRPQGWSLAELIAIAAPGHPPQRVTVIGSSEVSLDGAALHDPEAIHVLKSNQHGEYVFRVWQKGARYPTREVRRVTKLVID
jgi:hypothetical protein